MLDLELVKTHLNVDQEFMDDDLYIMNLVEMAEKTIIKSLDLSSLDEVYDSDSNELKDGLREAQLLLVGHWYANREAVSFGQAHKLPLGFEYLLQMYKNYDYTKANGIISADSSIN